MRPKGQVGDQTKWTAENDRLGLYVMTKSNDVELGEDC